MPWLFKLASLQIYGSLRPADGSRSASSCASISRISSRKSPAISNSRFPAPFYFLSELRVFARKIRQAIPCGLLSRYGDIHVIRLVDLYQRGAERLDHRLWRNAMLFVESRLKASSSIRFTDGPLHGIGNRIGINNDSATNVACGPAD